MLNPPRNVIVGAGFGGLRLRPRKLVIVVCALASVLAGGAGEASADTGALTQKRGLAGCVSDTGSGGLCADGTGLDGASSVAVSPDGRSVYAASYSDTVVVLDRAADGTVTQKPGTAGCISNDGSGGQCADGTAIDRLGSVTVSPDGRSVYATAFDTDAVVVLDRAADGTLTQKPGTAGCISNTGSGGQCVDGTALNGVGSVTVSPDGRSVYATALSSHGVVVFDRAADGTLTQKPGTARCISDSGSGGDCVDGTALNGASSVTVSPDGRSVYAASDASGAVVVFDRAAGGALTQKPGTAGCISETGSGGECVDGAGLEGALSVVVSPDGRSVYVASGSEDAVVVLDRAAGGALTQKPGTAGCVSDTGSDGCADGTALVLALSLAISPDARSVYVASLVSDAVAVFDREPAPPVTPTPTPGPAPAADATPPAVLFPAELEVTRARIRADRRLDVVAPIGARASGPVSVRFRAAGRTKRFTVAVDEARDRVRFRRRLSKAQARTGRGVLTLAYSGDADTRPQRVRLRVGPRAARLRAGEPRIEGGRLRARGRIAKRARGFVRVQLSYQGADVRTHTLDFKARVRNGGYRLDERLSAEVRREIASRLGSVHASTLYAGHARKPIRGELRSHDVTVAP